MADKADDPIILAFDTAMASCAVAVLRADGGGQTHIAETIVHQMPRGQAELLVPMLQDVLAKAGLDFAKVDAIGTTIGPGAFTGLRIGLSTARTLGLALEKPVIGSTTLDVLARQFFDRERLAEHQILCVLIETKRKDFYVRFYDGQGAALTEPQALETEEILMNMRELCGADKYCVFIGDALTRFQKAVAAAEHNAAAVLESRAGFDIPDPLILAQLSAEYYQQGAHLYPPDPLYLRGADVSEPKKKRRLLAE